MDCISVGISLHAAPAMPKRSTRVVLDVRNRITPPIRRSAAHLCGRAGTGGTKALLLCDEPLEQRRRSPARTVGRRQSAHGIDHPCKPGLLRPEHRAAPVRRKAVTVDVDYIDVGCADRYPFFQY